MLKGTAWRQKLHGKTFISQQSLRTLQYKIDFFYTQKWLRPVYQIFCPKIINKIKIALWHENILWLPGRDHWLKGRW